jgi:DNA-binding NtrC family response regulator
MRVLVVDDEADIRQLIRTVVAMKGYETLEAEDGLQALEMARQLTCDLIITDQEMPGMKGLELIARLKSEGHPARYLVVSGHDISGPQAAGLPIIVKPFTVDQLLSILEKLTSEKTLSEPERESRAAKRELMNAEVKGAVPESTDEASILISNVEEDHRILQNLFQDRGWTLYAAMSLDAASILLVDNIASVVITEQNLAFGNWRGVLDLAQALPQPPLVIVISRLADDYLWAEALNLGAYDVLAKPLVHAEVIGVLTSAWLQQFAGRMKAARDAYTEAAAHYNSVTAKYRDMLDHPDGPSAVRKAAENELRASQRYKAALKAYSTFLRRNHLSGLPETEL